MSYDGLGTYIFLTLLPKKFLVKYSYKILFAQPCTLIQITLHYSVLVVLSYTVYQVPL